MKLSVLRFCSLAALAAAMTACSSDEPADTAAASAAPQQGITITAKLPVENTLRPRSGGSTVLAQGHNIKRVIYAIYSTSNRQLMASGELTVAPATKEFSFNVDVPKQTYFVLVWADAGAFSRAEDQEPYHVDLDKHTITMNTDYLTSANWTDSENHSCPYPVAEAQPDDMDAFMFYDTVSLSTSAEITLTRPLVAMALFSDCTDSIYSYAKMRYMGSKFSFGDGYTFADTYDFDRDIVTMSKAGTLINYVDFQSDVNQLFCPWGFSKYKVLAYQYSFAPKNSAKIPFEGGDLVVDFRHTRDGGLIFSEGRNSSVSVDLGEPSTWFKPNTCVALVDDSETNGGKSALINTASVTATVSTDFGSTIRH